MSSQLSGKQYGLTGRPGSSTWSTVGRSSMSPPCQGNSAGVRKCISNKLLRVFPVNWAPQQDTFCSLIRDVSYGGFPSDTSCLVSNLRHFCTRVHCSDHWTTRQNKHQHQRSKCLILTTSISWIKFLDKSCACTLFWQAQRNNLKLCSTKHIQDVTVIPSYTN